MTGPPISHTPFVALPGAGAEIGDAFNQLAGVLLKAHAARMEQQRNAMEAALQPFQQAHIQAETEQANATASSIRAKQKQAEKDAEDAAALQHQVGSMMGPVIQQLSQGRRPGDPEFDAAVARSQAGVTDPATIQHFNGALSNVMGAFAGPLGAAMPGVQNLTPNADAQTAFSDALKKIIQPYTEGAQSAKAHTDATVAGAEAPAKIATAQAQAAYLNSSPTARRFAGMDETSRQVMLENMRENFRRQAEARGGTNSDAARRNMMLTDVMRQAHTAHNQALSRALTDTQRNAVPSLDTFIEHEIQSQAGAMAPRGADGQPDSSAVAAGAARLRSGMRTLLSNAPTLTAPTGNATRDQAYVAQQDRALRAQGYAQSERDAMLRARGYTIQRQ